MSIQMTLIFGVLVSQMVILSLLLLPLPHVVRTNVIRAWKNLRKTPNYSVSVIFTLGLMTLQFVDCLKKLKKYSQVENPYYAQAQNMLGSMSSDKLASKFYAQRNLYITGAVLYLSLAITTVLSIISKLVDKETLIRQSPVSKTEDDAELKALIKKRETEIEAMKKQLNGVQTAYDSLTESEVRSKDD